MCISGSYEKNLGKEGIDIRKIQVGIFGGSKKSGEG